MAKVIDVTEGVHDVSITEKLKTFPGLYRATYVREKKKTYNKCTTVGSHV